MEVKPLDDVMHHFQWIFFAYVVLFIIVCVNFYKAIHINKKLKDSNYSGKSIQIFDLGIDVLCGLAMAAGCMFQGVLADNNALDWTIWTRKLEIICIASFIIFILNVIVVLKEKTLECIIIVFIIILTVLDLFYFINIPSWIIPSVAVIATGILIWHNYKKRRE